MSSNTLIIHPGQHKTGSSAIQSYLFEQLDDPRYRYLHDGQANASLWLLQCFKRELHRLPGFAKHSLDPGQREAIRKRALGRLRKAMATATAPASILSAESMSLFQAEEMAEVSTLAADYYSRVEVHQYYRPHKSKVESGFQQQLKQRFVNLPEGKRFDYRRATRILDRAFGRDRVHVHLYAPAQFPGGSVVAHFCQQLGIAYSAAGQAAVNRGLSQEAVKLLYIYRSYYPSHEPGDSARLATLAQLEGPALHFHSQLYREMFEIVPGSMAWQEQRMGQPLAETLQAHDAQAIRREKDLLAPARDTLEWLAAASDRPRAALAASPAAIGEAVRSLG